MKRMLFLSSSFQKEPTKSQSISILVVRINIPLPFVLFFIIILYFCTKREKYGV